MIELALILIFIAPSWAFAALYYQFGIRRQLDSQELMTLNANLRKVNLFWSNGEGNFKPLTEGAIEADHAHFLRSFFVMTAFLSLLSLLGMILLILIFVSGRPRLEMNAFKSALALDPTLDVTAVGREVAELQSLL